jgi:hypothetical protein
MKRRPVDCGQLPFLIRRDGTWLYRGSPIGRKELVCLFASVLKREEDGSFWLETPAERGRIEVEDAPFVVVEMDWCGVGRAQQLTFRTNVDEIVTAGPEHPIRVAHDILTCEPTPYIQLRRGAGRLPIEARISRAVYYELVALAEPASVHCRRMRSARLERASAGSRCRSPSRRPCPWRGAFSRPRLGRRAVAARLM